MDPDNPHKPRPDNADKMPQRPRHERAAHPEETAEGAPVEYGVESEQDYPREADYGDQEKRYDNKPPGRGHGDEGYGYGGQAGFAPSGGSDVRE